MKQQRLLLLFTILFVSCGYYEAEELPQQGILSLSPKLNHNQTLIPLKNARASSVNQFFDVKIYLEDDLETVFQTIPNIGNTEEILLPEGNYVAKAYTGIYYLPSFTDSIFSGQSDVFSIRAGEEETIEIPCKLENVKVSIAYTQNTLDFFDDIYTIVSTASGSLLFESENTTSKGFFEAGNFEFEVQMQKDGVNYQSLFSLENIESADWLKITFDFSGQLEDNGLGNISLIIDESQNEIPIDWELDPVKVENTSIFISEYVEGSSYNKGIELYNPTSEDKSLDGYTISIYANGATEPTSILDLSGTLLANETYLILHSRFDMNLLPHNIEADTIHSINITGNDVFALSFEGKIIDQFGTIGDDSDFAKDKTLRRKVEIESGKTSFDLEEWEEYEMDYFDNLGLR